MNIEDCEECKWMGYDALESEEVCMLNDEMPIGEIEFCNDGMLTDNQEILIIEESREK